MRISRSIALLGICTFLCLSSGIATAENPPAASPAYIPFDGEKSTWHEGFDRYDYVMDRQTMAISPFKRPENERFAIGALPNGNQRGVVICPKKPAPGNPWSWRGCYWDHQPQTEVELLKRGFHIAYIWADATTRPDEHWKAWYTFLTENHGLSKKPAFIGMSRGGEYAFTWSTLHPDKVSCIYADNPGMNDDALRRLIDLARADVPVLLVCGTIDPILQKNAITIENMYQHFSGRVSMMLKDGAGHHPHSLIDPTPLADFIERSVNETAPPTPDFVAGNRFTRSSYYSIDNSYEKTPRDGYITRRGAAFNDCFNRFDVALGFPTPVTIIAPKSEATGRPWVLRAGFVDRDARVDQALLAKGYHIVVGPVGFNADGPTHADWDKLYAYLTNYGFSKKPVMEGAGGAAGAVYDWAIANPDKVACIYAENPILRTGGVKVQPLDNLAPLAKANVPILHVCGSLDPALDEQTRVAEKRYKELGGNITVIIADGVGHYPTAPQDVKPVVQFIAAHQESNSSDKRAN